MTIPTGRQQSLCFFGTQLVISPSPGQFRSDAGLPHPPVQPVIGPTESFAEALRRTGPSTLRRSSHCDRDRAGPRLAKHVPLAYPGDAPQPYFAGGMAPEFIAEVVRPAADSPAE